MKKIIFILVTFSVAFSWAQEITSTLTASESESGASEGNHYLSGWGGTIQTFPLPILSHGIGVSLVYKASNQVLFSLTQEREGVAEGILDEGKKIVSTNRLLTGKYLLSKEKDKGFFLTGGYKWSEVESSYTPTIMGIPFGPRGKKVDKVEGAIVGAGYRFHLGHTRRMNFMADIGVNYEPGETKIKSYDYDINSGTIDVKTKVRHGFFPEAKITGTFQ